MPVSLAVAPMVPVPAPAAALGDQLDRRRSINRRLARWLGASGAACADTAAKATPLTNTMVTARISASIRNGTLTVEARGLAEAKVVAEQRSDTVEGAQLRGRFSTQITIVPHYHPL
jgi:hypothetical protein